MRHRLMATLAHFYQACQTPLVSPISKRHRAFNGLLLRAFYRFARQFGDAIVITRFQRVGWHQP